MLPVWHTCRYWQSVRGLWRASVIWHRMGNRIFAFARTICMVESHLAAYNEPQKLAQLQALAAHVRTI